MHLPWGKHAVSVSVTDRNFKSEVLDSKKPVLVKFGAEWCAPCRTLSPVLEELVTTRGDFKLADIDVEKAPQTQGLLLVMGLPSLMLFRDGKIIGTNGGLGGRKAISEWIDESLAKPPEQAMDIAQYRHVEARHLEKIIKPEAREWLRQIIDSTGPS